jgi:hypothetical protein
MKHGSDDYRRLLAELSMAVSTIRSSIELNSDAWTRIEAGATAVLDWAALAYTIHNLYGSIEQYCTRIAKFYENNLSTTTWHAELLERMTLNIEGVRPALYDRDLLWQLDDLRRFRHLFRHMYDRPLDSERVKKMQQLLLDVLPGFLASHERFIEKLQFIASKVTDE